MLIKKILAALPLSPAPKRLPRQAGVCAGAMIHHAGRCGDVLAVDVYNRRRELLYRFYSDGKNYVTHIERPFAAFAQPAWTKRNPTGAHVYCSPEEITASKASVAAVETMLGHITSWRGDSTKIGHAIQSFLYHVRRERRDRAWDRKMALQKAHFGLFPEYPADLAAFCEDRVFQSSVLYVSKLKNGERQAVCRHCGKSFKVEREVKPAGSGICPKCGCPVIHRADWLAKEVTHKAKVCIACKVEGQLLLRYVEERTIYPDRKEPEYHFSDYFKTLLLVRNGKATEYAYAWCQAPYCGYDWRRLRNGTECLGESYVYTPNLREVFGERYYNVDLQTGLAGLRRPISFRLLLDNLKHIPQAEYLMKAGLPVLAAGVLPDTSARSLPELTGLGILKTSQYQQWFTLRCRSSIEGSLHGFSVDAISIKAIARSEGNPMRAPVPFIPERQLELDALKLLKEFGFGGCIYTPQAVDPALLAQRMGLTIQYRHISKERNIFGAVFMDDCEASFYQPDQGVMEPETVPAGTIVVDREASQKRPAGSVNNTVVHECVHWHRHRKACCLANLMDRKQHVSCLVGGGIEGDQAKSLLGMEWQANALAPKIQMPYPAFRREARRLIQAQRKTSPHAPLIDLLPSVIEQLAERFQVSKQAAKIRLLETKCPEARGVLEYIDGCYVRPYAFAPGALGRNQTFTVSAGELAHLYEESEELRALLQSGEYTVAESHVCLNDPRYVFGLGGGMPMLTEYARLHVDECCLKFAVVWDGKNAELEYYLSAGVLYREEFLPVSVKLDVAQEAPKSQERRTKAKRAKEELETGKKIDKYNEQYGVYLEDIREHLTAIQKYLRKMTSFPNAVEVLRDWRGYGNTRLAYEAHIEYRTLMYSISPSPGEDPAPSLDTVFRLCIALKLPYPLSRRLMELAGFTLNDSFPQMAYDFALRNYNTFPVEFCIDFIGKFKRPTSKKKKAKK